MLRRTAQQREKKEIIKGLYPLVLKIRVMLCPPSRKNLQLLPLLAMTQGLWIYVWSYPEDYGFF